MEQFRVNGACDKRRPGPNGIGLVVRRVPEIELLRLNWDSRLQWRVPLGVMGLRCFCFMELGDILSPEVISADMKATNRWEAIDELIGVLVNAALIKPEHREAITAVVKKRETSMSTGIGFGIGIPHASTDLIGEVIGAFGRSKDGINFDALDNQPVNLVMLFLVPQGQFQKHLHTLARIAKTLHKKEFRQALEEAPDGQVMYNFIKSEAGK